MLPGMAINQDSTTTGSLWNRLGQIGGVADFGRTYLRDAGQFVTDSRTTQEAYIGTGITASGDVQKEEDIGGLLRSAADGFREGAWLGYLGSLRHAAQMTLHRHVWRDTAAFPKSGGSRSDALRELYRQMVAASANVTTCAIGLTPTAGSTNTGNGTLVTSTKRGDGRVNELAMAETLRLRCDEDGHAAAGIKGYEKWLCIGQEAVDGFHPNWAEAGYGSGCRTPFRTIDPESWGTNGNLLVNGFETFPSSGSVNTPVNWATDGAGTDGADFAVNTTAAQVYFGTKSLRWIAGTGVNTVLAQYFNGYNQTNSTPRKLEGSTQYAVIVRLRRIALITAGVLTLELTDAANAVLADDQAVNNSGTTTLATLLTNPDTWYTATLVVRTPKNVPNGAKLRLRMSTALAGADLYMDSVAQGKMTHAYRGGPAVAKFAGSTPWIKDDFSTLAVTNSNGGAAHARKTFHRLADAAWDLKGHDIVLPSTGAPAPGGPVDSSIA